jgi:hypothetical protein
MIMMKCCHCIQLKTLDMQTKNNLLILFNLIYTQRTPRNFKRNYITDKACLWLEVLFESDLVLSNLTASFLLLIRYFILASFNDEDFNIIYFVIVNRWMNKMITIVKLIIFTSLLYIDRICHGTIYVGGMPYIRGEAIASPKTRLKKQ